MKPALFAAFMGFLPALLVNADYSPVGDTDGISITSESFELSDSHVRVVLPDGELLNLGIRSRQSHANGDQTVASLTDRSGNQLRLTVGKAGIFGQLDGPHAALITTDNLGLRWVSLPESGVSYNLCGLSGHTQPRPAKSRPDAADNTISVPSSAQPGPSMTLTNASHVVDVLIIYNHAIEQRYPGELVATRLNHLIAIANDTLANSELDTVVRLVGSQLYDYPNNNDNLTFRNDIADALGGNPAPSLAGLAALREDTGADLVIGLRPHDIEIRGNCGIAFFPDNNPDIGVNIVSDGNSSWSFCLDDVLTHEIGHNLGATHQTGSGGGFIDPRGAAFVVPGQFTTMMASFGTGRPDRFLGLPVFSNPLVQCGNQACGITGTADNATVMRDYIPLVAGYTSARTSPDIPQLADRSETDRDGDGVIDWLDAFPFDNTEQADSDGDGTGDNADAFPLDSTEQIDTDNDGLGNVSDNDDDNDGFEDVQDRFPLIDSEWSDTDSDGVGDNQDVFSTDPNEFVDSDLDGNGNNQDDDDDNDGTTELDPDTQDILVISAGNSRILRFDAANGRSKGVEVPPWDSLITFQSAMTLRSSDNTLVYSGDSGLRRVNLLDRSLLGEWVPAFAAPGDTVQLNSGFPTGIVSLSTGRRVFVSLLGNSSIAGFRGQEAASPDFVLNWSLGFDSEPAAMASDGDNAYLLGEESKTVYIANGLGINFLAGPDVDWLQKPGRLTVSNDGRLLIVEESRNAVLQVDAVTGEYLGDLISLSSHGINSPRGLAVTNQNELLIATGRNTIEAFDADSGGYLGVRVPVGSGGLNDPGELIIIPALLDRFATDPERIIQPNAGLWFDPEFNGRGYDIQVYGSRLSAIWYTYDATGLPVWYLAAGELEGDRFSAPLDKFSLHDDGSSNFEAVGELILSFENERQAVANFEIEGVSGTEELQWITFTTDVTPTNQTGLWGRQDGPGWGLSLANQGNTTVAIAYVYDANGQPVWFISDPEEGNADLQLKMNASFSDTLCPACSGPASNQFEPAGTMRVRLGASSDWSSEMIYPMPLSGQWLLENTPILRFSDRATRPR